MGTSKNEVEGSGKVTKNNVKRDKWSIYETKKSPNQLCWLTTHEG